MIYFIIYGTNIFEIKKVGYVNWPFPFNFKVDPAVFTV